MCRHLTDNAYHKVDFAKPYILSSVGDSARLLILESLFIQKHEPLLNVERIWSQRLKDIKDLLAFGL